MKTHGKYYDTNHTLTWAELMDWEKTAKQQRILTSKIITRQWTNWMSIRMIIGPSTCDWWTRLRLTAITVYIEPLSEAEPSQNNKYNQTECRPE